MTLRALKRILTENWILNKTHPESKQFSFPKNEERKKIRSSEFCYPIVIWQKIPGKQITILELTGYPDSL